MDERELYDLKWFDYKPLSPDTATLAFCQEYCRKLGDYYQLLGEGVFISAVNSFYFKMPADFKKWRHFKTAQKLRQWADSYGMRYEDFWAWAFEVHQRFGFGTFGTRKGNGRFILFNGFAGKSLLAAVLESSRAHTAHFVTLSDKPYFQSQVFAGETLQVDYHRYLIEELRRRFPTDYQDRLKIFVNAGRFSNNYLLREAA